MFPGCLEYCNAERTLSEYSRNIAYRFGYYLRPFLHSLTFELDVTITKAYDFSESVRVTQPARDIRKCPLSVPSALQCSRHPENIYGTF